MSSVEEKCLGCGASLKYNEQNQKYICEYCHQKFNREELIFREDQPAVFNRYSCLSCGADIIYDKSVSVSNCLYCDKPVIVEKQEIKEFQSEFIIPFEHNKQDIIDNLSIIKNKNFYYKKDFFKSENIISLEGVYVPYLLVNSEIAVSIRATTSKGFTNNYYTRRGTLSFKNIPINTKDNDTQDEIYNVGPFDYSKKEKLQLFHLKDHYVEKYNSLVNEEYQSFVIEQMSQAAFARILRTGRNIKEESIFSKDIKNFHSKLEYCLVPIWIAKIKYKNKIYTIYINDQNFNVSGMIKKDIAKCILLPVSFYFLVVLICLLVFHYCPQLNILVEILCIMAIIKTIVFNPVISLRIVQGISVAPLDIPTVFFSIFVILVIFVLLFSIFKYYLILIALPIMCFRSIYSNIAPIPPQHKNIYMQEGTIQILEDNSSI